MCRRCGRVGCVDERGQECTSIMFVGSDGRCRTRVFWVFICYFHSIFDMPYLREGSVYL